MADRATDHTAEARRWARQYGQFEAHGPVAECLLALVARVETLTRERDQAIRELEHWKGCNLYPHTYREAVESVRLLTEALRGLRAELATYPARPDTYGRIKAADDALAAAPAGDAALTPGKPRK